MRKSRLRLAVCASLLGLSAPATATTHCGATGVAVQVLGSGGPEAADRRASSGYLLWQNGRARLLVDAGGGVKLRFGEAGASMADLDAVAFTHFHADHSSDFAALVKSSYFEDRSRALPVYGPPGNALMPGAAAFVDALFGKAGAFRYLGDFLDGSASYTLEPQDVNRQAGGHRHLGYLSASYTLEPQDVNADGKVVGVGTLRDMRLSATAVEHGPLPALAWRVEIGGAVVAFSGDTSGKGDLVALARDADIFVAHNAVPVGTTGAVHAMHMTPDDIGRIAAQAKIKKLVLSHRMLRTLGREVETLAAIRARYAGPVEFADDLSCYPLNPAQPE